MDTVDELVPIVQILGVSEHMCGSHGFTWVLAAVW